VYTRGSYVVSQEDEEISSESSCSSSPPPSPSSDLSSPPFESFSDIESPRFSLLDSHIESCEDEDSHVEPVEGGSLLMHDKQDEEEEMMRNVKIGCLDKIIDVCIIYVHMDIFYIIAQYGL